MSDYFEIDFLDVESAKSGDAIPLRYELGGTTYIHVVDGGFQATGEKVVEHIKTHYANPTFIHHVIATHPDGDHAGGLRSVLEEFQVGALWMLRPWHYADELLPRFARFTSTENLKRRLKEIYPNLAALEEIAIAKGIPIYEPFQGAQIGAFTVMAPSRGRYLDLIVESERTPESVETQAAGSWEGLAEAIRVAVAKAVAFVRAAWGEEVFSPEGTSCENEMSVVQHATLCGKRILLTADAGRDALTEAADYAEFIGLTLPGVDRFQVPHHGSRRNVSTEILDRWLGERLASETSERAQPLTAIISSAKADEHHPRKSVVRACIHRGAKVISTEGASVCTRQGGTGRAGWGPVSPLPYPSEQEA